MAERRRRRLSENDSGDEFSQDTVNSSLPERPSECESEGEQKEPELSEYESTVDESREIEEEESEEETETEEEDDRTAEEDSGDDVVVEGAVVDEERQSGDGEEQPNENLDDDEDKKNPAYIPRKGAFFEHDMRLDPDADERTTAGRGRGKGRLWKDETKWIHDRYLAEEQAPKSRQELIALYGYDILVSDTAPDAPPRMNARRGPRGRKFQDFIPSDGDRPRSDRYTSDWVKGQNQGQYENDYPPVQSDYSEDYPPPRRQSEGRGRGGRGGRGSRGQGQRRNYSDLQEDVAQRNRPFSNRDRGFEYKNEDDVNNQDNFRANRNTGYRGGRSRTYSDDSEVSRGNQDNYRRGFQDNRNRGNYGGNRDNFGGNRDNFRRDGNKERDNYGGNKDTYPDSKGDFSRNRDNFGGNRDNIRGKRDNFRGRNNDFQGNRDYNKGPRDNYRYERSDSNPDSGYQQNRNTNYREDRQNSSEDRQNRRFNENQNYQSRNTDEFDTNQDARADFGNRRFANERSGREARQEDRERRSETRETRQTGSYEQREGGERQYLRPEQTELRSKVHDKLKSYYTLSPVTDDEKLLNEGLEFENSANSPLVRDTVQDLNIMVSDMGNRKTFAKEKRGSMRRPQEGTGTMIGTPADDGDSRKPQHTVRHQPTLPPRLQQQQQERKKQQAQAQTAQAQAAQHPSPSPAPIAERIDQSQRGSSKRYSSQRQRNVPEGPGYQEGSGVPSPVAHAPMAPPQAQGPPPSQAPVQIPKLSEPAFFNPAFSPPKPGVSIPPPMIRPPPNFPPPVSAVMPASTVPAGPRVPSPQRVVAPQIIAGAPLGPPPVFATSNTSEPVSVAAPAVSMIMPPPPSQLPLGVMYAVPPPPPPFQLSAGVPVPQFPAPQATVPPPAVVPPIPQSQPQESVRGGTTYYSSEGQSRSKSTGVTYYPPEVQKKNRVTVRRPKVAIPIVNPEAIKKEGMLGSNESLEEPSSASPSTVDPPLDSVSIAAVDMDKLKLEPHSHVSPGETNLDDLGSSVMQHIEPSGSEHMEDSTGSVAVNQNVEAEQSNYGQVEASETAEFYDAEENPVQSVDETNESKDCINTSHEHTNETKLENETESRLKEQENSVAEIDQSGQGADTEEDLRTRTVSVSDKLIPEVKLEFKVHTDSSGTHQNEQEEVIKTEAES